MVLGKLNKVRSLQSFHNYHKCFMESCGDAILVKEFYNCISIPFLDIPPSYVCDCMSFTCLLSVVCITSFYIGLHACLVFTLACRVHADAHFPVAASVQHNISLKSSLWFFPLMRSIDWACTSSACLMLIYCLSLLGTSAPLKWL